jgi:hypothetical protein
MGMKILANFPSHRSVISVKTAILAPTHVFSLLLVVSPVAVFEVYLTDVCQPGEAAQSHHQQPSYKK